MAGELGILNVGAGDTKLSFDPKNPAECIRAARIVKDMLKRGYALLVQKQDGTYTRVLEFDDKTYEYIIADFDPIEAAAHDSTETKLNVNLKSPAIFTKASDAGGEAANPLSAQTGIDDGVPIGGGSKPRGRPCKSKLAAASTSGVAVSRTAGG